MPMISMKSWKEKLLEIDALKKKVSELEQVREGLCKECLKWPCEFQKYFDKKKEKVTWCKGALSPGDKIEITANVMVKDRFVHLAGKKFAITGVKETKTFKGYFIHVKGKELFVPKQFGHPVQKKP